MTVPLRSVSLILAGVSKYTGLSHTIHDCYGYYYFLVETLLMVKHTQKIRRRHKMVKHTQTFFECV